MKGIALAVCAAMVGCRQDGHAPDRPPSRASGQGSAQPAGGSGQGGAPTAPASEALVAVPREVASKVTLKAVLTGLDRPVLFTVAPGDARKRWFVVEQRGAIRIAENGKLLDRPFLAISGLADGNEQGLLGLAFHPDFAKNGRLYINYTVKDSGNTHVDEYTVSKASPDVVDMASKRELFVIDQPYSNHNGGNLVFGPDGRLYVGMGDGGAANDPHGNGQNDKALLAKLLRIDVDTPNAKPEIVHKGLRNPWRFSFDSKTGDLYIGDVGQNLWEYVHAVAAGDKREHDFGWNIVEGNHCFDPETGAGKDSCDRTGLTPPLVEYAHDEGCSITGGYVYRGKALPGLDGRYFYADFCTGILRSFVWSGGAVREHWDWKRAIDKEHVLQQVSSFGVDGDGELYIVTLTGSIYELVPAP